VEEDGAEISVILEAAKDMSWYSYHSSIHSTHLCGPPENRGVLRMLFARRDEQALCHGVYGHGFGEYILS
jgi:hypothetical protein